MRNAKSRTETSSMSQGLVPTVRERDRDSPSNDERCVHERRIRILRLPEVLDATGLGKTKIYELQSKGSFPMRVRITDHSVGWIEEEVQAWLAKRVALSISRARGSAQFTRR